SSKVLTTASLVVAGAESTAIVFMKHPPAFFHHTNVCIHSSTECFWILYLSDMKVLMDNDIVMRYVLITKARSHARQHMATSLEDVAKMAGVSISTVSRALHRPDMVGAATRERIQAAVNVLGYIPQGAGRALVSRKTHTVGAVVPRIGVSAFGETVEALRQGLGEANYTLLLAQPPAAEQTDPRPLRTLIERGVDAIVLLENAYPSSWQALIRQNDLPLVSIWSDSTLAAPGAIGFDNYASGKLAAEHLLHLGHREFAYISGRLAVNIRARQRYQGLLETFAASGGQLPRQCIIETDYGFQQGYEAAATLLARNTSFSALICGNDYLALGAMFYLRSTG